MKAIILQYVRSLYKTSHAKNIEAIVYADMKYIALTLHNHIELHNILTSPVINHSKKNSIFKKIFARHLNILSIKFFSLIVKKKRTNLIYEIANKFVDYYETLIGMRRATLISASPLNAESRNKFTDKIINITGCKTPILLVWYLQILLG